MLRPARHPEIKFDALSSDREDVRRRVENRSKIGSPRHSRSPKLVQGHVQTSSPPTTRQADLSRSLGRLEKLPRLPQLDAPGSVMDTTGHSLFSPATDTPARDPTQTKLTALPPLRPRMRGSHNHLPKVPSFQIAQFPSLSPNRPQPIEPSALVPTCISRLQPRHKFPGPLRYRLDNGIYEDEARKVL